MTQLKLAGRDDSDEETQRDHARDRFHNTVKLGQGAEGRAFRAQDSELERDVIVKVVVSADRDITSNVENLRRLNHPNISKLLDYKVRILNTGTEATTRVLIESTDRSGKSWFTIGVSPNIIEASFKALIDSLDYKLFKDNAPASL